MWAQPGALGDLIVLRTFSQQNIEGMAKHACRAVGLTRSATWSIPGQRWRI